MTTRKPAVIYRDLPALAAVLACALALAGCAANAARKKAPAGKDAREAIEKALGFPLTDELEATLGELLGPVSARHAWESILKFMAGSTPTECPKENRESPGTRPRLQNDHAISIAITTVLPLPVAILQP